MVNGITQGQRTKHSWDVNNKQYIMENVFSILKKKLQINGVYMIKQKCTLPFIIRNYGFSKGAT
jgi:hypothetical protein